MSIEKASSESRALQIALGNFSLAHPATSPISSTVSKTRSATARGVASYPQYAVEVEYESYDYRRQEPSIRSACYLIDAI